jgi:hypothetical protein
MRWNWGLQVLPPSPTPLQLSERRGADGAWAPLAFWLQVDIKPVPPVDSKRHKCILKDAGLLTAADVDGQPLDLVFFDAHVFDAQWSM